MLSAPCAQEPGHRGDNCYTSTPLFSKKRKRCYNRRQPGGHLHREFRLMETLDIEEILNCSRRVMKNMDCRAPPLSGPIKNERPRM